MRYQSLNNTPPVILRGPRGRSRSVLATNCKRIPPRRNNIGKAHTSPKPMAHSDNVHIVYHAVPVSRLAG